MPRPRVPLYWQERIKDLVANPPEGRRLKDREIAEKLAREAHELNPPRDDYPSERSVGRIRKKFLEPGGAVSDYQHFHYPDSCLSGALPWEAAAVAFELIRHNRLAEALPVRLVRWLYRVTLAMPSAALDDRLRYAIELATRDAGMASPDVHERMATGEYRPAAWDFPRLAPMTPDERRNVDPIYREVLEFQLALYPLPRETHEPQKEEDKCEGKAKEVSTSGPMGAGPASSTSGIKAGGAAGKRSTARRARKSRKS